MKLTYQVEVEVTPGDEFNPLDLMNAMSTAIDKWRMEGLLTPDSDEDTEIGTITFGLTSMTGDLPSLVKKAEAKARKAGPRVIVHHETADGLWYAKIEDNGVTRGYIACGETRQLALTQLFRHYPEAENMIITKNKKKGG